MRDGGAGFLLLGTSPPFLRGLKKMAWDPLIGYVKERYTEFPDREEATADLSNLASRTPDRAQMFTGAVVASHNPQQQQGTPALTQAPVLAGNPAAIQWS